ncbi:MAG: killer suppression protein HigA [Acidobacteriia bacterium]|nr:killer suppression protein HigA [Terriglobia bacterium]
MEVSFKTKKLAKVLNSTSAIRRTYGARMERDIATRLALLRNAPALSAVPRVPPERLHQLKGHRKNQFAIDLTHPFRLVFVPDHKPLPLRDDGGIDLTSVTSIMIVEIVDYH